TFDAVTTQGGAVTAGAGNTSLTYTPVADFNGTDSFTFTVTDGLGGSNVATVTLTVNPVNDAVVCTDVLLATPANTALTINAATDLVAGCSDVDGDTVVFASAAAPANANSSIVDDGAGTLTYTPETDLIGTDSFVFTATDGNGGDGTATASIKVGVVLGNFTMLDVAGKTFGGTNDVVFTWDGVSMHTAETDVASNMTIVSEGATAFFGAPWYAHHVRVFGPGTYTFEANNALCESKSASPDTVNASTKSLHAGADDIDVTGCPGTGSATTVSMTVAAGQVGVHMLFDYNGTFDIDVVNVYDKNAVWNDPTGQGDQVNDLWTGPAGASPDPLAPWGLVSRDVNGDGINGSPMVDGPFVGFYANFNDAPSGTAAALPPITTGANDTRLDKNWLGALNWVLLVAMLPLISVLRRRFK
ncbi:MAG: cadherin-like domain-containing protein, partial [Gammaproteobacteria bacterium]|nr:cadherin-like domain-containing protein [Gammaproteobacteria bacterium]